MKHINNIAIRKVEIPGWEPFYYEQVTNGMVIKGGIPRKLKSGKNKGKKKWDRPFQTVVVTDQEIAQELIVFEKTTGKCGYCYGEGIVPAGWSREQGPMFLQCAMCHGSGKSTKALGEK